MDVFFIKRNYIVPTGTSHLDLLTMCGFTARNISVKCSCLVRLVCLSFVDVFVDILLFVFIVTKCKYLYTCTKLYHWFVVGIFVTTL